MRYVPMNGVSLLPVTTSQLTAFGLWKRIDSILHPCVQSWTTSPTPLCAPPAAGVISGDHTTFYPNLLHQYSWLMILVSVSIIGSKSPICTSWMDYVIPNPQPLQMLKSPIDNPQGAMAGSAVVAAPCEGGPRYGGSFG